MKPRYDLVVPLSVQEVPMSDWPQLPQGSPWWALLVAPLLAPALWRRLVLHLERRATQRANDEAAKRAHEAEQRKADEEKRREEGREITAQHRIREKSYDKDRPVLVQQLERAQDQAKELLRERDRALANETWLREENATLMTQKLDHMERLEKAEGSIDRFQIEIRECHDQRDLDAQWTRELIEWVMREFTPKNASSVSQPPKRRSITPREMPAIPRAPILKIELDDFFEPK